MAIEDLRAEDSMGFPWKEPKVCGRNLSPFRRNPPWGPFGPGLPPGLLIFGADLQETALTRIIHETFTAEAYMSMSTVFCSLALESETKFQTSTVLFKCASGPDTQCQANPTPRVGRPQVASLVSMPIYAFSLQTFMNNPG